MMERYFYESAQDFYADKPLTEAFPDIGYQVGVTPEKIEKARDHCNRFEDFPSEHKPISECPPIHDSKWRYFWNIGEKTEKSMDMNYYPNVIPKNFPEFEETMNNWGDTMLSAVETVAEMIALGFGLERDLFLEKMKYANHLLAPTGSDLKRFETNTAFAGVHYDLNFITIHGKSNYGGLYIWLRNGNKHQVEVPTGCLILQAGIQLEMLTGGEIRAGFHEVIYTEEVKKRVEKIIEEDEQKEEKERRLLWRVSSTCFAHIRGDVSLEPVEKFRTEESLKKYPPITAKDQVIEELKHISLL